MADASERVAVVGDVSVIAARIAGR